MPEGFIPCGTKSLTEGSVHQCIPAKNNFIIQQWADSFAATGKEEYRQLAIDNMQFVLSAFAAKTENEFHHTWKDDLAKYPAFLDDYAFLIQALIQLQEITADTKWLIKAKAITKFVIESFSETETGLSAGTEQRSCFFFYTPLGQRDVIVRKKEVYDGAVPSANSTMAYNLHQLSLLFDKPEWEQRSRDMLSGLGGAIIRYPTSFGNWACLLQEIIVGTNEIALVGGDFSVIQKELLSEYIPHRVFMSSKGASINFPLLADKQAGDKATIYLCRNYTCQQPVFSAKDLITLINRPKNGELIFS